MKAKLFDYIDRDNYIYNLSGLTKLIAFICLTFSVMFSYDIRYILLSWSCPLYFSGCLRSGLSRSGSWWSMWGSFLYLIFC